MGKNIIKLLLISFLTINLYSQVTWDYPVKPGDSTWKAKSFQELKQMCQIPSNLIKDISTNNLIDLWLRYPFLMEIFGSGTLKFHMQIFKESFNGDRELLSRQNRGEEIIKYYEGFGPFVFYTLPTLRDKGNYEFKFVYLEILMFQPEIIDSITSGERDRMLNATYKSLMKKFKIDTGYYTFPWEQTAFILLAKLLQAEQNPVFMKLLDENKSYVELLDDMDLYFITDEFRKSILNICKDLLTTVKVEHEIIYNYNLQNFPNPFNGSTSIKYTIPKEQRVKIEIYNILGQKVDQLMDDRISAGDHIINWTPGNKTSGIYYYILQGEKIKMINKLVYLK